MSTGEQIAWKVVKEADQPLYHLSLVYPWAERIGAHAANIRLTVDEDELRSLQDAIAEALYGR